MIGQWVVSYLEMLTLKRSSFCILLLAAAIVPAPPALGAGSGEGAGVQEPAKPKAPAIPSQINEAERVALTQSALLLSRSEFDKALAPLKPLLLPATAPVYVDWAPVPKAVAVRVPALE